MNRAASRVTGIGVVCFMIVSRRRATRADELGFMSRRGHVSLRPEFIKDQDKEVTGRISRVEGVFQGPRTSLRTGYRYQLGRPRSAVVLILTRRCGWMFLTIQVGSAAKRPRWPFAIRSDAGTLSKVPKPRPSCENSFDQDTFQMEGLLMSVSFI